MQLRPCGRTSIVDMLSCFITSFLFVVGCDRVVILFYYYHPFKLVSVDSLHGPPITGKHIPLACAFGLSHDDTLLSFKHVIHSGCHFGSLFHSLPFPLYYTWFQSI